MVMEKIRLGTETFDVPRQGFLDHLTRIDELLVANLKAINGLELVTNLMLPASRRRPLAEMKRELESGMEIPYTIKSYAMDTARTNFEIVVEGDQITAATSAGGTLVGVTIRFNIESVDAVPMEMFNPWKQQFFKIYLTHTAQSSKTLYLAVCREAAAESSSYSISAEFKNQLTLLDSTTTNLIAGATYTSAQFNINDYGAIIVSVLSDRNGTLYVDQSADGTNYDIVESAAYTAAGTPGYYTSVYCPYGRVRFTNPAGAATTSLRILTFARRV